MKVHFTAAKQLNAFPEPAKTFVDICWTIYHELSGKKGLCTVEGDIHTHEGHMADIWVDVKRLFVQAVVMAVIVTFAFYLPVFARGAMNAITTVSNPVAPVNGAPANNVVPSNPSVVPSPTPTLVPTSTQVPTVTSEPTLIPLTATPTVAPTETAIWFTPFTPEQCDLRSDYSSDFTAKTTETQWSLVKLIPYLRGLGYHGQNGDGFFVASVDEVRVILTLVYKKDPNTPQIALPQEMWGSLPTNRFCMISGNWTPLSPFFGDVPIQ